MNEDVEYIKKINREDCVKFDEFDKKYNVETSHPITEAIDKTYGEFKPSYIDNVDKYADSQGYQNTALAWINLANEYLKEDPNICNYTFIDIGAGKGRVILHTLATNDIYKEYIGIEIDENLAAIFEDNLKSTNIAINKPVTVKVHDARNAYLKIEPTVFFIFRPFTVKSWDAFMRFNQNNFKDCYFVLIHEYDYTFRDFLNVEQIYSNPAVTIYKTLVD
jgi:SAM-dependent methyltransferase